MLLGFYETVGHYHIGSTYPVTSVFLRAKGHLDRMCKVLADSWTATTTLSVLPVCQLTCRSQLEPKCHLMPAAEGFMLRWEGSPPLSAW